jgi:hypothetical protein
LLDFDDLRNRHCLLLDGMSMQSVSDSANKQALNEKYNKYVDWRGIYSSSKIRAHALDVLSRLVVYDYLVVDRNAIESLNIRETLVPTIMLKTEVPEMLYITSGRDARGSLFLQKIFPSEMNENSWWDSPDKIWVDSVGCAPIANSNESPARTFFYLTVANAARVPLLLSPNKATNIESVQKKIIPEIYKKLERSLDGRIMKRVNEIFSAKENDCNRGGRASIGRLDSSECLRSEVFLCWIAPCLYVKQKKPFLSEYGLKKFKAI